MRNTINKKEQFKIVGELWNMDGVPERWGG